MNTSRLVASSETAWRCTSYSSMERKSHVTHTHTRNGSRHMKRPGGACHIETRGSRYTHQSCHTNESVTSHYVVVNGLEVDNGNGISHTRARHTSHITHTHTHTHSHTHAHTHARANETRKSSHTSESRHTNKSKSVTSRYLIGHGLEVYLLARDLESLYARG